MLSNAVCMSCNESNPPVVFKVQSTTQRWVLSKCPAGHPVGIIFQASGWARLFDRGLERLAFGELRDAILDAYTAFEMYLADVPIRVRYDREPGASPSKLREEMRAAISRSENAIGAARSAASIASGKPVITWNEGTTTAVRNRAIHGGVYPSEKEAEQLCLEVGRTILAFEATLDATPCVNPGSFYAKLWVEEATAYKALHPTINPAYVSGGAMFDWSHSPESRPTVAAQIALHREIAARRTLT